MDLCSSANRGAERGTPRKVPKPGLFLAQSTLHRRISSPVPRQSDRERIALGSLQDYLLQESRWLFGTILDPGEETVDARRQSILFSVRIELQKNKDVLEMYFIDVARSNGGLVSRLCDDASGLNAVFGTLTLTLITFEILRTRSLTLLLRSFSESDSRRESEKNVRRYVLSVCWKD